MPRAQRGLTGAVGPDVDTGQVGSFLGRRPLATAFVVKRSDQPPGADVVAGALAVNAPRPALPPHIVQM
jgi:hypothetical protein